MAQRDDVVWSFVRGALPTGEFESWCYESQDLEHVLGKDFYLDAIATPFGEPTRVTALKKSPHEWLRKKGYPTCECFLWKSLEKLAFRGSASPERF